MPGPNAPFYPIIYVRGYAMTAHEKDETTSDPFCGFNLGSTVYRATTNKDKPQKFVFESPILRLIAEHDYGDVYHEGFDVLDEGWTGSLAPRSIIIYRYYDQDSTLLGTKGSHSITQYAQGLNDLILRMKELICKVAPAWDPTKPYDAGTWASHGTNLYRSRVDGNLNNPPSSSLAQWWDCGVPHKPEDFRCYLVAHSMGGLICRAFLQNPKASQDEARNAVDKVFTYATPHNGIEMAGINVPDWLTLWNLNVFDRGVMAEFLNLKDNPAYLETKRVDYLPEKLFPSRKFFCMIGTNRADYQAAMGVSRTFAGNGSDGLVRIDNASLWGVDDSGKLSSPCATAFTYRSHSGYFGIVNSEEAYQNLSRFLFGDLRVDIFADVSSIRLPADIKGKAVDALYQFEILTSPLGRRWYLSRRIAEEDSVACRTHQELTDPNKLDRRHIYLSSAFLSERARVNPQNPYLEYSLTFGVRVPDYEVEHKFWINSHHEGAYLYRETIVVRLTAPKTPEDSWKIEYAIQKSDTSLTFVPAVITRQQNAQQVTIPFGMDANGRPAANEPGISGQVRFMVSEWNR